MPEAVFLFLLSGFFFFLSWEGLDLYVDSNTLIVEPNVLSDTYSETHYVLL